MAENVTAYNVKIIMSAVGAKETKKSVDDTRKSIKGMGDDAKKSKNKINELWGSLKRIATYRLLRTALKAITTSISEGVKNLYEWSKLTDGRFASSMDRMSTAFLQIKNSLAVALAPLIENVIVPLMEKMATVFVAVSNQISMFAARLKGETKYLGVATAATKEYEAAQRSLLGFDELNKLSGGGGFDANGNGYFDYFVMPETSIGIMLADAITKIKDTAKSIFKDFSLDDVFAKLNIKIDDIKPEILVTGAVVGALIIGGLKKLFSNGLITAASGATGTGLATGGLTLLATTGLILAIGEVAPILSDQVHDATVLEQLNNALNMGIGALIGFTVGGSGCAALGALVGLGLSLLINTTEFKDKFGITESKIATLLEKALQLTGIAGITLLASGNLVGGAIAMALTVGLAIAWVVKDAKLSDELSANVLSGIGDIPETTGPISVPTANKSAWNDVSTTSSGITAVPTVYDPKTGKVSLRANGGFPSQGSMFIAGEAGAEFVGNIGGRTGVMNTDQMSASVAAGNEGVIEALFSIANTLTNAIANQPVPSIQIGDRDIYQASQRGAKIVGGSLVKGA